MSVPLVYSDDCDPVSTECVNHDGGYVCECISGYVSVNGSTTYCAGWFMCNHQQLFHCI